MRPTPASVDAPTTKTGDNRCVNVSVPPHPTVSSSGADDDAAPVPRAQRLAALDRALPLLTCPVCRTAFRRHERVLLCPAGHTFDIARAGYVNLLGHAPGQNADTPAMVDARARFLATRAYRPIADAVAQSLADSLGNLNHQPAVAEFGAGPGYYLSAVLDGLSAGAIGLATDVSPAAVRHCSARGLAAVVADTWRHLPLRDACLDGVCCVFAPRHAVELARVVRPHGIVVLVTPSARHLADLRQKLGLIGVRADAGPAAWGDLRDAGFEVSPPTPIVYAIDLGPDQVTDLVDMGPNAHHGHATATGTMTADVSVDVAIARHR
jgi:23S rRNA (guanine745-N1)-methyltransferase